VLECYTKSAIPWVSSSRTGVEGTNCHITVRWRTSFRISPLKSTTGVSISYTVSYIRH